MLSKVSRWSILRLLEQILTRKNTDPAQSQVDPAPGLRAMAAEWKGVATVAYLTFT